MNQEDVYELQQDLSSELETVCDKLTMWQSEALKVLDYDDSLEELRDQVLHVQNLLDSLQCKTI